MTPTRTVLIVSFFGWLLACVALAPARAQDKQDARPAATVLDGVYSEAQAARGKTAYVENCSSCHGENLKGTTGPSLVGADFIKAWDQHSVNAFLEEVRATMPQDYPGQLPRPTYLDIVTYVLQSNEFPAGKDELPNDPDVLKSIKITKK